MNQEKKIIPYLLVAIFILGVAARFYNLRGHGIIFPDEVNAYYFPALKVAFGQDHRGIICYPLHILLLAAAMKLFGVQEINKAYYFALLYPATLSSLTIILVYFIGKVLFNYRIGILAAASLCLMEYHLFYGKTIMAESGSIFFGTLATLMLCFFFKPRLEQREYQLSWRNIFLMSITLGLGIMLKPPTIFFLIPIGVFFSLMVLSRSLSLKESFIALLIFSLFTYLTILSVHQIIIFFNFLDTEMYQEGIRHGWASFAQLRWNPYWSIPPFWHIIWYRIDKITFFFMIFGIISCLVYYKNIEYLWTLLAIPSIMLGFSFWLHLTPPRNHVSIIPYLALLAGIGGNFLFHRGITIIKPFSRNGVQGSKIMPVLFTGAMCLMLLISGFIHSKEAIFLSSGYDRAAQLITRDNFNKGLQLDSLSLRIYTASGTINDYQQRWYGDAEAKELDYLDPAGSVDLFLDQIPRLIEKGFTHFVFDYCYTGWGGPHGPYTDNIRELLRRKRPTFVVPNPAGGYLSTSAENFSRFDYVLAQREDPILKNIYIYRLTDLVKGD
jgi:hypothetical protein